MPRKKKTESPAVELPTAEVTIQPINETIEKNFMPYAMSVIVARAIPEIDGFKPAHRKLLYTMYRMGLLGSSKTVKCATIVGETMKLNPHGDAAIYDTLVRLTRDHETLLHPFVFSKGSFGKHYSNDEYAAPRYTEAKLENLCREIFSGIEADAVDMTDNYDGTLKEPVLLPTAFPNILVSPNKGIAVAMSSSICSFNLAEVCDGAIQMLHNPDTTVDQLLDIIKAPDFQGGGYLLYNREILREIYRTGKGTLRLRARYTFDKAQNCIEVVQIPYSTTIDLITKRLSTLVKEGKLKELTDFRDEIDKNGFTLALDIRRGVDPDKLMNKLFKLTPLEDTFDCNFTVLVNGTPQQLGVGGILRAWIDFRLGCIRREFAFDLHKKQDKLHLLLGLCKILLDIDKAIRIVRETEHEEDVVPNLMEGFDIDEIQAEYIAEIKLRQLNREYILNRTKDIAQLQQDIADINDFLASEKRQKEYIIRQLKEIKKKYAQPRQTQLLYEDELIPYEEESEPDPGRVHIALTREGYFKKITLLSLRGNDEHKLKEGDEVVLSEEVPGNAELLFFGTACHLYRARVSDFDTCKASELGDFIPAKLGFEEGERVLFLKCVTEYRDDCNMVFFFQNGKGIRVPVTAYQTKSNRRRLTGAYSDASPAVAAFWEEKPFDVLLKTSANRALIVNTALIPVKTTRDAQGVAVMTLKEGQSLEEASTALTRYGGEKRYRKTKIPSAGATIQTSAGTDDP